MYLFSFSILLESTFKCLENIRESVDPSVVLTRRMECFYHRVSIHELYVIEQC